MVEHVEAAGYTVAAVVATAGAVIAQDWLPLEDLARWGTGGVLVATAGVIVRWVMRTIEHVKSMWTDALEAAQAAADRAEERAIAAEARAEQERERRIAAERRANGGTAPTG